MNRLLGKLAPEHDSRTLKFADYLTPVTPKAPKSAAWQHYVKQWGMLGNDSVGDCAIAAPDHRVMLATAQAGDPYVVTTGQALTTYSAVSGYDPVTGANDNGCVILDVLKFWQKNGIVPGHEIGPYVSVNIKNIPELELATYLEGGLIIGLQLPAAAQNEGNYWETPTSLRGNNKPGSWGGHCVYLTGYVTASQQFTVISWGEEVTMDYGFAAAYMDEAWAVFSPDFLNAQGVDAQGLSAAQLQADLNKVKG